MTGPSPDAERSASNVRKMVRNGSHEAGAWLAAIVQNSEDAILSKTMDGVILSWNAGAERLFGYTADEAIGKPVTLVIPEDRLDEEETLLSRLRSGERVEYFETVRRRKDDSLVDVSLTVSPVKDENGNILGAAKIARDISSAREAAVRQDLIIREMNHRIKNLFTLANSLVALSARSASSVSELAQDLTARLQALSRAHGLTLPDLYQDVVEDAGTSLDALFRTVLAPYDQETGSRVDVQGDLVPVGEHSLPALALLLHELATNAAKYGALASPGGKLNVSIEVDGATSEIRWHEAGGPPRADTTSSEGFGSRLEQASLRGLKGELTRTWTDCGVEIVMRFPLEQIAR
ncbi:putative sensor histidine kinase [Novosphingobium sp. Rr 2-17]|uniref:PAS domain S-box protein n=1 Tax=Novosphingobium sp. Rr 2-17 TaxID=555793 RepID=UPI0002697EB2|nr:PAS domain S-box protein [Novosphingobium sp. Rr 2-17]EIZ79499.1 putative sensor histidine kinase [Novosphingobium sp. Rr 2-17]